MPKINTQLVLRHDDYKLLLSYLNGSRGKTYFDRKNTEDLQTEMKKARIVNNNDFPEDVIRLNSMVRIRTEGKEEIMELVLVTPDKADNSEKKISIMSPIGTALLGFRQGQKVKWHVPYGQRTLTILEVINEKD
jgi:regulator of nucleoside diphosphate kinase